MLWLQRGSWGLADQWFFSGANFIANILLARWLPMEEYGAFALAFSIFLFVLSVHSALLTEPMLVLGSGRLKGHLRAYLKFLLQGHMLISLLGMALFLLALPHVFSAPQVVLSETMMWMALSLPILLLPWLLRRFFNLKSRTDLAAISSAIYMAVFLCGILLAEGLTNLSGQTAFMAMGLASLVSCLPFLPFSKTITDEEPRKHFTGYLNVQWAYAKWSVPSAIAIWVSLNFVYLLIPYFYSLQETALFKAASNLVNPLIQSNQALAVLLLPQLSHVYFEEGKSHLMTQLRAMVFIFLGASILYLALLVAFGPNLVRLLFGEQYIELTDIIPWAASLPIFVSLTAVFASGLRAMEQPDKVFTSYILGAITTVTFGAWLTAQGSVSGALAGQGLAHLVMATLLSFYIIRNGKTRANRHRP